MYSASILILGLIPPVVLAFLARFDKRGGIGPSPMAIMAWLFFLGYSLKSIYLSFAVVYHLPFRPDWIAFDIVDIGQLAIVLGMFSMIAGYYFGTTFLDRYRNVTPLPRKLPFDPKLLYYPFFAASVLLLLAFFQQMGFVEQLRTGRLIATKFFVDEEGNRNALGFLSIGADFLIVFFIYYLAMAKRITWLNVYTVSLAFVVLTLFLASRRNVVIVIIILSLTVLAVRNVNANALRKLFRLGLVGLVLVGLSFASQIRTGGGRSGLEVAQLDVGAAIETSLIHAFEGAYFIDPAKTAAIIDRMDIPEDLFWGASFVGFIIAPIPRVIWPNKPSVRVGPFVAQELFDFGSLAGVPPGAVGEFYLNFGWLGIVLGMMGLGGAMSFFWWRHRQSGDPRFTIVRYSFLMIAIIYFLSVEFSAAVVIFLKYYVAIFVAEKYWVAQLYGSARRESPSPVRLGAA